MVKKIISDTLNKFLLAKYFWIDILVSYVVGFVIIFISYFLVISQSRMYFLKTFESKTLSQLEIYHISHAQIVRDFFHHLLNTVDNISKNKEIKSSLFSDNLVEVQKFLDSQIDIHNNLHVWSVFDKTGKVLLVSTKQKGFESFVGKDYSFREYFQSVIQTKKPYISNVFVGPLTQDLVVNISAPVFDNKQNIEYVINGTASLKNLQLQLNTGSSLVYYYNALLDKKGNIIAENGVPNKQLHNIVEKDNLLKLLLNGKTRGIDDEINYRSEKVFAMGDSLRFIDRNVSDLYFVSYFPKTQYEQQIEGLKKEIQSLFIFILLIFSTVMFVIWAFNIWLISRGDHSRAWYLRKIGTL